MRPHYSVQGTISKVLFMYCNTAFHSKILTSEYRNTQNTQNLKKNENFIICSNMDSTTLKGIILNKGHQTQNGKYSCSLLHVKATNGSPRVEVLNSVSPSPSLIPTSGLDPDSRPTAQVTEVLPLLWESETEFLAHSAGLDPGGHAGQLGSKQAENTPLSSSNKCCFF